jgi:biotin carboxyl carrier protein
MKERWVRPLLLTAAITFAACARPPEADSKELPDEPPTPAKLPYLANPLSTPHVFLVTGPHNVARLPGGVKHAVDFAGIEKVPCKNNESKKLDIKVVSATAGTVVIAGGRQRFDKTWSIVEVDTGIDGFSIQYIHVDDIKVIVGDKVKEGDELGVISCEYPEGGSTDEIHLHMGIKKNGKPYPINGANIAGWEIKEGPSYGDGFAKHTNPMFPWEQGTRTASLERCADKCQGARNDVFMPNARPGVVAPTQKP